MIKKIKNKLIKLFCKHNYVEIPDADFEARRAESFAMLNSGEISQYCYVSEYKCGKEKLIGSDMHC